MPRPPRSPRKKIDAAEKLDAKRLICPFYAQDPTRYRKNRSCLGLGFKDIPKVMFILLGFFPSVLQQISDIMPLASISRKCMALGAPLA
jgi:hypothetical protein